MKPEWCPPDLWREAGILRTELVWQSMAERRASIARALLDAHQRGRREGLEEAAEVAEHEIVSVYDDGPETESGFNDLARTIADAIRAKAPRGAKERG